MGPERARAAEADLDLVVNQEGAVPVAGAAEALEKLLGGGEDAALALQGLDEDGAGLSLGEDGLCGGQVEIRDGVDLDEFLE